VHQEPPEVAWPEPELEPGPDDGLPRPLELPELAELELDEPELALPELALPELALPELALPELALPELAVDEFVPAGGHSAGHGVSLRAVHELKFHLNGWRGSRRSF
jgi:hypothetical protein